VQVRCDEGSWVGVTASIGVAHLDGDVETLDALLAAADGAMYQAKAAGRDCVRATARSAAVIDLTALPDPSVAREALGR
jgi:diguanylate cyclase (GGDEF)-like protein